MNELTTSCDVCGALATEGGFPLDWRRVRLLAPPSVTADVCSVECAREAVTVLWGSGNA